MTPASRTDIDTAEDIERLVRAFYRRAATDDLLGPVFEAADVDWPHHIDLLTRFWAWQLLGIRGYEGHPLRAHESVHGRTPLTGEHFERWLELFTDTVEALFVGPIATLAVRRAERMASAMRRLLRGEAEQGRAPVEVAWPSGP